MAFPISEKAGCVWCRENAPCVKVGFRLFCKSLLQRNIPLIFCRGVYTLLCLLWVINQVTNPHLFKVKGRNLGPVITNLFSEWPFSLKNSLAVEVQQSILWWLVSLLPSWSHFPCYIADSAFSQPYETLWSHISLMSCVPPRNVCSEEVVSPGGELSFVSK